MISPTTTPKKHHHIIPPPAVSRAVLTYFPAHVPAAHPPPARMQGRPHARSSWIFRTPSEDAEPPAPSPSGAMAPSTDDTSSNPKRSAVKALIPLPAAVGGGGGSAAFADDGGSVPAKRRRTVDRAAALMARIAALEAAVTSGKVREAALKAAVAGLEADNARLSVEVASLRKRPRLPPSLTEIGESAFSGCTSLAEITLPPALTEIGESAFSECTSLAEITLPASVAEIGESAFSECIVIEWRFW